MYPCLASSGLDMPLDFSLDFPLDFALDGCDFGIISQIKALNPLVATDSALLNLANVGRPIPQRTVLDFNGVTQHMATPFILGAVGSLECHFNADDLSGFQGLCGTFAPDLRCYLSLNGNVFSGGIGLQAPSAISGTTTLLTNTWYHGKITWDGITVKLFLNGVEEYSGAQSGSTLNGENIFIGSIKSGGVSGNEFNGSIAYANINDEAIYDFAENGGTTALDSSGNGNHGTYINNPAVVADNSVGSDPLNERGFTEGTGLNGAAIGEYLVARLDTPAIDVGGNATQWQGSTYPVLPNITGTSGAFTALNTNVADDGDQTPAIRLAGLPVTWTQGDANTPRFQAKDNGDSTSSLALGLPSDPTPTEQISIDKYHE